MEEEKQDDSEVLETTETTEETEAEKSETAAEETPEQLKARITELEANNSKTTAEKDELQSKNKQLFERLKKQDKSDSPQAQLSAKEIIYLGKADIHADDMDEVLELARLKNWDVPKAHEYLKPVLDTRAEQRRTADATQTRGGARGASKVSGEDLLATAERTGEVPETTEGMNKLFKARMARKLK